MAGVDVRAIVDRLGELSGRVGALLLELDDERQRHAPEAASLRGASAAAWQSATLAMGELWSAFQLTSDRVQAWSAKCLQGRASMEQVAREIVDSKAEETVRDLLQRVQDLAEKITSVWAVRDVSLPRLAEIGERLDRAEAQARHAGIRWPNEAETAGDVLSRLRRDATDDPLSVPAEQVAELATQVERIVARTADEIHEVERASGDLDRLDEELTELGSTLAEARAQAAEKERKIAGPSEPDARIGTLGESVERLRSEVSAARASGDRARMAAAVHHLRPRLEEARHQVTELAEDGSAGLRQRRELRGRLDAYRAKAVAVGRGEDLELDHLFRAASDALYSAPCDLVEAERRVAAYQRSLQRPVGRT